MGAVTTPTPDTINPSTPKKKGSTAMLPNAKAPRTSDLDLSGTLSPEHKRMLYEESAISHEVVDARGYYTAASRTAIPDVFPKRQRKLGLVIPLFSPDGETVSYQLRPTHPISSSRKYETPTGKSPILDVHPLRRAEIKDVNEPVLFTEGAKTADAATSQGMCTAMLTGVWNFGVKGTHSAQLIPCFDHVPLQGRTAYVAYDADSRTNPEVQEAMRRFVARLEERGARVLVIYPPVVNDDPHTGIDDYLAAGGDFEELIQSAQPFEPVDVRRVRLSKDERLRLRVEALWEKSEAMPTAKQSDCVNLSIMRGFNKGAETHGKVTADGIEVRLSLRTLAQEVGVSAPAASKSVKRLEEKGYIRKAPGPRDRKKAQAYILLSEAPEGRAFGLHKGEKGQQEKETLTLPDKREPLSKARYSVCVNETRGGDEGVPELRNSKTVLIRERVGDRWQVVGSDFTFRLGKKRGEILRYLVRAGGAATVAELMERFARSATRARDFRRRQLSDLEGFRNEKDQRIELGPPIVEVDGDTVRLTKDWRENLEVVRTTGKEQEDAQLQADKIARQRERFHNPEKASIKADLEPPLPNREQKARILREGAERDETSRIEEQRRKAGVTCEVFVHDKVAELGRVRLGLLREAWMDRGGNPAEVSPAVWSLGCRLLRLPEHDDALFVYPPAKPSDKTVTHLKPSRGTTPVRPSKGPADVVPFPTPDTAGAPITPAVSTTVETDEPAPLRTPKKVNGVFVHGPLCGCDLCEYVPAPRYARPVGGRA